MKKCTRLLLMFLICLMFAGCSKTVSNDTDGSNVAMSWQAQYDLGIRLLAEGNYEEAILVFQAAIQIDPKQSVAYQKLAEAYVGVGDYEKAASALEEGFRATGEKSLEQQLKDIQDKIQEQKENGSSGSQVPGSSQEGNGSLEGGSTLENGSPMKVPQLPDVLSPLDKEGEILSMIVYLEEEYVVFDQEIMNLWKAVIEAGVTGDREGVSVALTAMDPKAVESFSTVMETDYVYAVSGWTQWNGDLFGYSYFATPDGTVGWSVEYRAQDGKSFAVSTRDDSKAMYRTFYSGNTSQWLFDGEYTAVYEEIQNGMVVYFTTTHGNASKEMLQGDVVIRQEMVGEVAVEMYYHYEQGVMQDVWADPNDEQLYPAKRVEIRADGTEHVDYMMFGTMENLVMVEYVMGTMYVYQE